MKANQAKLIRSGVTILALVGAVCLPLRNAGAQQDRQLTQNGSQPAATNAKRIALVIGNGAYASAPPLKNPPNDARDMAATLRTLGFDVASGINVNQKDMKRLIREFGVKLKTGGSGLFYYAGHGVQSKGRNYLVPIDADIQSEAEVEDSGVDASLVLNYMDDAQNGLNIVILDACRNNPFARSFRSASDGLAQVDAPTGTLIAYATAPGRVASDGTAGNGLYTAELLKQMRVPGVSVTDMFMRVRAEVMKQTGNKQVPWEASSLVGAFYFTGAPNEAPTTNSSKIDPAAFELSYWETIKNSQNADDFRAYLEKYPDGQFAALAKNRIASTETAAKPTESKPANVNNSATELAFWDAIKNSTRADDYRDYLEKYPNGEFVVLAKRRLEPLEATEKEKAKGEQLARNIAGTWKYDNWGTLTMLADGTVTWNNKPAGTWAFADINHRLVKFSWSGGAAGAASVMTLSADGQRLEGTESRGMPMVFTRIGGLPDGTAKSAGAGALETFRGGYGINDVGENAPGAFTLSQSAIVYKYDHGFQIKKDCRQFAKAYVKESSIYDIAETESNKKYWRFDAASPADAVRTLEAINNFCSNKDATKQSPADPNASVVPSTLEGTTWKGDSLGGDKHYEFRFQAGGVVVLNLKMASNVTWEGMWSQNGNAVTMNFRGLDANPFLLTVQGNQMSGSWRHGRYQLTVARVQ